MDAMLALITNIDISRPTTTPATNTTITDNITINILVVFGIQTFSVFDSQCLYL